MSQKAAKRASSGEPSASHLPTDHAMDLIPIPVLAGSQAVHHSLAVQLRQCQAMVAAEPSEHNRYQVVRLERLLQEIRG